MFKLYATEFIEFMFKMYATDIFAVLYIRETIIHMNIAKIKCLRIKDGL